MTKHQTKCICIAATLILFWINTRAQHHTFIEGKPFSYTPRIRTAQGPPPLKNDKYRRYDGTYNNIQASKIEYGSTEIKLARELPAEYGITDKFNALNDNNKPSARAVSNLLCDEPETVFNARNLSAFVYVWGQFLDHDITLTPTGSTETVPIKLPIGETIFTQDIPFSRSEVFENTGVNNVKREQINLTTAWIDASNVYGSDETRARWLRTMKNGKMKTSSGNLLPYNTLDGEYENTIDASAPSMANDKGKTVKTFVAGDIRASEHPALLSLHTLFVREHNSICDRLKSEGMSNDEDIYQMARKEVGGIIQAITYNEFLPAIGIALTTYTGYKPTVIPDILNSFATASYRLGHTMVADDILMIDAKCAEFGPGELDLLDVFWNPGLLKEYNIEYFLKGLAVHPQYETDLKVNSVLRNFLFGDPQAAVRFGLDLASINIQRGRDHGLPNYNAMRRYYIGSPVTDFNKITTSTAIASGLKTLYGNVNNIDLWVGLLAEDKLPGKSVGRTLHAMLKNQFEKLRAGDFYFYASDPYLPKIVKMNIEGKKLSVLLQKHTGFTTYQRNVFFAQECPESANSNNVENRTSNALIVTAYPTAVSNYLNLDFNGYKELLTLQLCNANGMVVKKIDALDPGSTFTLDVSGLAKGLYVIKAFNAQHKETVKFMKID